jgi:hypothetical protein
MDGWKAALPQRAGIAAGRANPEAQVSQSVSNGTSMANADLPESSQLAHQNQVKIFAMSVTLVARFRETQYWV